MHSAGSGYFDLNLETYELCVRIFERARHLLGVRIKMHHDTRQLEEGDIFLFNHFARAETFIPQYCIYQETGAVCRSIAAGEFFRGGERLSRLLREVGAVPNDYPELLPLLAVDILKGRKIIVFPEGGMVKDRQVVDDSGEYSVYSRASGSRRKHHSGAARLAIGVQIFKQAVMQRVLRNRRRDLEAWSEALGLPSAEVLIECARKPVTVVPANITFYPLRAEDNFLRRGADLVLGGLSPRTMEELIIEGNLFFKATDMDIRCGSPIRPHEHWEWWEKLVASYMARNVPDLGALFAHEFLQENPLRRIAARGLHASIDTLRDRYMAEIYRRVTVNLSHLAATALLQAVERGEREVEVPALILQIYLALKRLQPQQHIHLHRSLINPGVYRLLLDGQSRDLQEFLASGVRAKLLELHGEQLRCLDKLEADHAFDAVRLENPIEVCANEVAPLPELAAALREALIEQRAHDARAMAMHAFDDARRLLAWDRQLFQGEKHREINAQETATADPAPFLLLPTHPRRLGVLLVHGFLASPGETRPFGEALARAGYPVMGVRLRGHGTSPWDLRERAWRNWFESLQQGYQILAPFCTQICIVGFSTGGALTLISAAQAPTALAGIVAIAPPFRFRNHNMRYVPLVHGANQLVEWVSNHEGVLPFRPTTTEHPDINYRHMPIRGLYELTRMVATVRKTLPDVRCPTLVIQGTEDPVVEPAGAEEVIAKLGSRDKRLAWVPSQRHGILYEAIGDTQRLVFEFLARLEGAAQGQQDAPLPGPATASEVR